MIANALVKEAEQNHPFSEHRYHHGLPRGPGRLSLAPASRRPSSPPCTSNPPNSNPLRIHSNPRNTHIPPRRQSNSTAPPNSCPGIPDPSSACTRPVVGAAAARSPFAVAEGTRRIAAVEGRSCLGAGCELRILAGASAIGREGIAHP